MKSVQLHEYGKPVTLVEAEPAPLGDTDVRVAIEAAPLNPSDFLTLSGRYAVRPPLPSPVGGEGVGVVTETGAGVTAVRTGDLVLVLPNPRPGTWQEEIVVPERFVVRADPRAEVTQLATAGINAATAYLLLSYGELREGDWVVQTAANSGLGTFVNALAKLRGVRTLNVVRRADAVVRGGDAVVVSDGTLTEQIAAALAGDRPRLLLDGVSGPVVTELAAVLAPGAHIVSFGALSQQPFTLSTPHLLFKNLTVHGFWLNNWIAAAPREEIERVYADVTALIAEGVLRTEIAAEYALADYARAIEHASAPGRTGKVVFTR
ncbi:trans-2-enoyl-CoA reductase [Paractinoplanes deccanensis]|uniref:enoyl-[acyl-carrier-protein] reductase n=1 Tax=Paractinoplanes deccanensis TaxID=113561 RepID=A0ABQ3Y2P2_9ACTN|nr:zinc-dependent alcohol dehydrogenase family protein [Actinoplanes deccanensis]GID74259.1 trans-2-enoyl-CoA reductase [Actinoplanes deccanensis]